MKIILRTSGGRGEYELAGSQAGVQSTALAGKNIFIEVVPGFLINTHSAIAQSSSQGKPRIRLADPNSDIHTYRILASLLFFDKPIRELSKTYDGKAFNSHYSITEIDVDLVKNEIDYVVLRPKTITAMASNEEVSISFSSRFVQLINNLEDAGDQWRDDYFEITRKIQNESISLKKFEKYLIDFKSRFEAEGSEITDSVSDILSSKQEENDPQTERDSFKEDLIKLRMVKARGPKAIEFSKEVKRKYDFTCLFSGNKLPKTSEVKISGVEAAHILPWASFGINSIQNGICLNGLCHWAFDSGLIFMHFDRDRQKYFSKINPKVLKNPEGISLDYFIDISGEIPEDRLPANRNDWPNPDYLDKLNSKVID